MLRCKSIKQVGNSGYSRFLSTLSNISAIETQNVRSFAEIPHPPESLLIGGSLKVFTEKTGNFTKMFETIQQLHHVYGPIFKYKMIHGSNYVVAVSDPNASSLIYSKDPEVPVRPPVKPWVKYREMRNMPIGIVSTNDKEWKRLRMALNEKLFKPNGIREYIDRLEPVAKDTALRILDKAKIAKDSGGDGRVNIDNDLFAFSLEAVSAVVLGKRLGVIQPSAKVPIPEHAQKIVNAVDGFFKTSHTLLYSPQVPDVILHRMEAWKKHVEHTDYIFKVGEDILNEKLQEKQKSLAKGESMDPDLLSFLIERPELSPLEAHTTAIEVLMAGVDTTSRALQWLFHNLAKGSPALRQQLRNEVISVAGVDGRITEKVLSKLPFLKACVRESLRLFPIASPNTRVVQRDLEILGYQIPSGTEVQFSQYAMSHDATTFEDPEQFKPERWMSKSSKSQAQAYSSLPFGFGPRMCPGRRLAETEIYLLVANLIRLCDIEHPADFVSPEPELSLLMVPNKPLYFHFRSCDV